MTRVTRHTLPCFVCGENLQSAAPGVVNQPLDGLAFTTHGHYGSGVYDPMDGSWLELNICDVCVLAGKERVLRGQSVQPRRTPAVMYTAWGETESVDEHR